MELNRTMILLSGCFLIVWSTFKWKISHKLKKDKKGKVKNFQLGICSIFVILAMIMACFNLNEIYSSIMILSGMMMVISTPFQEMKSFRENSNNR